MKYPPQFAPQEDFPETPQNDDDQAKIIDDFVSDVLADGPGDAEAFVKTGAKVKAEKNNDAAFGKEQDALSSLDAEVGDEKTDVSPSIAAAAAVPLTFLSAPMKMSFENEDSDADADDEDDGVIPDSPRTTDALGASGGGDFFFLLPNLA